MERRWTLLATLCGAVVALGFLVGFMTAPRHGGPASAAASPRPSSTAPAPGAATPAAAAPATPAALNPTEAPIPTMGPVGAATPDGAVADFYGLVQQHQFDAAVRLWSSRMQAAYPPGENVYQRFADTTSLTLVRNQVSQPGDSTAVVSIDLVEVRAGRTYRWTGSWYLVRSSSTWLLDQPALRPG